MIRGKVEIDIEKCKGCSLCVVACKQETLEMSKKINRQGYHYAVMVKDNCTGCENCALVCPDAVITVYRASKGKSKEKIATISDVKEDIKITINK
jgi:2-oxoglutarate ferredoxin oxidoreductase subunit delta